MLKGFVFGSKAFLGSRGQGLEEAPQRRWESRAGLCAYSLTS